MAGSELKAAYFLERREMGIFNVGGNGSVIVDGTEYKFKYRDGLYIGMGSKEIKFKSEDSSKPAKFYFNSTPAHKTYPTVLIQKRISRMSSSFSLVLLKDVISVLTESIFYQVRLRHAS